MKTARQLVLRALILLLAACGGGGLTGGKTDAKGAGDGGGEQQGTPKNGVYGRVLEMGGGPLEGVKVSAKGAEVETDANGLFHLSSAGGGDVVVSLTLDGYVPSQKRVRAMDGEPGTVEVVMRKREEAKPLDNEAGGTVDGKRGAAIVAPPGVFVNPAGVAATGSVDVRLTAFDPSNEAELSAVPGSFEATTLAGDTVALESFGLVDIDVTQNGKELNIDKGKTVTVTIPAPESPTGTPPDTIQLWSFDEATARWKEEGTAAYDAKTNTYTGEVGHLSMWNCDHPIEATCIKGVVKDENGDPVPGAHITAKGVDYMGTSETTAGPDGKWCVAVRKGSKIRVNAMHPGGGGTIREVESGTDDTQVPPDCGTDPCKDTGEWVVEMGKVTGTGGDTVDCAKVENPFAGTCIEAFFVELMGCFQPSGACVFKVAESVTEWENGAKITFDGTGQQEYVSASGKVCATFDSTYTAACPCPEGWKCEESHCKPGPGAVLGTLALESGKKLTVVYDQDEEAALRCPDGSLIALDDEKQDVYDACMGGDTGAESQQCKIDGGGRFPSSCEADGECGSGQVCCTIPNNTIRMCMTKELCDMYKGCQTDADCTAGKKCCDVGSSAKMCLAQCPSPR